MTLIVEDGTQVANSNTYVSDAEYAAYAAARGATIGSDATAREIELIKSMDYIESYRDRFKGSKVSSTQSLQWPRVNVFIDGYSIDSDEIPDELKNAQMETGMILNSTEILNTGATQNISKEKVDVLDVEYFNGGSWETTRTDTIDVYLDVLLVNGGGGANVGVVRA